MPEQVEPKFESEMKALGLRIKQIRRERGFTVRDLVIQHKYHDAQWRRYEGGGALTVTSLLRIAKTLGTSLSILVQGVGEESPEPKIAGPESSLKIPHQGSLESDVNARQAKRPVLRTKTKL